ncbi:type II secretion system F family protein [Noviherbaspirillum denitrificans]|uniref:Pilus assembly protein TadB n=1 Tax=Noviherbaspirillum denitrificans TaxID=1968433 RepID=A0A254TAB4_9BURK|nr:type II secretion system F family protein [Noviherbaspirillum denitrificans]OWW19097.1 pilus assembly protein TadB [Noviherbaspirillum denitrificans]
MDILFLMFAVAVFIAVILLFEGLFVTWNSTRGPAARRVTRRLQAMATESHGQAPVSIRKQRVMSSHPALQRALQSLPLAVRLDRLLQQAGATYDLGSFLIVSALCAAGAAIAVLLLPVPPFLALFAAAFAAILPLGWVTKMKKARLARIEEQLPDALDLLSRALRAGHALPSGIDMVAREMSDPIAGEFRIVFDEVSFGVSMQDALTALASRVPSNDIGYFVVAVLIQRETGGNLTELLGNIAQIVRNRLKLYGQVRALSAEGRLSAWILSLLPFAITGMLMVINPRLMQVLWTEPAGLKMLAGMGVLMVFGIVWMRKIIRIRV